MAIADLAPGQHATEVRNHWWWRPGWRVGRRFYAFHITLEDEPELHRLASEYRSALSNLDTVTPVPDRWLHMTMQGLGFTDEVPEAVVADVADHAARTLANMQPPTVEFAQFVVGDEAVALPAEPAQPVQQIRYAVRTAIAAVLGDAQVPERADRYRPHVSVAYNTAPGSSRPYLAALQAVRPVPARVRINRVSLIELHRDHQMYEWTPRRRLPLSA